MDNKNKLVTGQRWMSETEPELGLGTLLEAGGGKILLQFETGGVTRRYSLSRAPVKRIRFKHGDVLITKSGQSIKVEGITEQEGLLYYTCLGEQYCETILADTIAVNNPADRLRALRFDSLEAFELRYKILLTRESIMRSPARGFCGARIDLFPHQLYIADTVSRRHVPRIMLSDQVGLGKTIEALLVINKLILTGRINSVLIIAPEHLVLQWFGELYHRLGLTFSLIDEKHCRNRQKKDANFNPFKEKQFSICSYSVLTMLPELRNLTLEREWDMVLVDEVHNLLHSAEEYTYFKKLSMRTSGLMLLSAIPEYPNLEDFFARLHLLDPVLYDKYERFFWEVDSFKETATLAEKLHHNRKLQPEHIAYLREKIPAAYLGEKRQEDAELKLAKAQRRRILEYLIDQHGMGRLLFRNTRKIICGFPERIVRLIPLDEEPDPERKAALLSEFRFDIREDTTPPDYCFSRDSRITWILSLLQKGKKILLICTTRKKVSAIESALGEKGFEDLLTFHEELDFLERDRRVVSFYEAGGPQLLVSSEIGSEGRNIQICRNLVFFDLPFDPSLIEQRIGRLDRIGQKKPIHIYIPYKKASPKEVVVNWLHNGLDIFSEFHDGHIRTFSLYSALIKKMALSGKRNPTELDQIIGETRKEYKRVKKIIEKGRDVLVELNSFDEKRAEEIIRSIHQQDAGSSLEDCLLDLLEFYGFDQEKISHRTYRIQSGEETNRVFAQLIPEGKIITFERSMATQRTDYAFITIDHELAARAIDLLLGQATGNCVYALRLAGQEEGLLLEAVYILECIAPPEYNIGRYLPTTPLRVLVDHTLRDLSAEIPFQTLCKELIPAAADEYPGLLTRLQESAKAMLEKTETLAQAEAEQLRQKARQSADQIIGREIQRLTNLKKVNQHIKAAEILHAQTELDAVQGYVSSARLRLDSLRLIQQKPLSSPK